MGNFHSDTCANVRTQCNYGGYANPANCNECLCPDGLGGTLCERNEDSQGDLISFSLLFHAGVNCGGILTATSEYKSIQSPGYPSPGYEPGQKCSWILRVSRVCRHSESYHFQAPVGSVVQLDFDSKWQFFCTTTCLDYVEVKDSDLGGTGKRFCCFEPPKHIFQSDSETMIVIFRSTMSRDTGFSARFRAC